MLHPDLTTAGKSNHARHQVEQTDKRTPGCLVNPTDRRNPTSIQFCRAASERCLRWAMTLDDSLTLRYRCHFGLTKY